jgi:hypothetical protein
LALQRSRPAGSLKSAGHAEAKLESLIMKKLTIEIAAQGEGWIVQHENPSDVVYLTKEAALQGAIATIETAMAKGWAIELRIPGGEGRFD